MTRFGKTDYFGITSETHFIAPYHRYTHTLSKYSDRITRETRSAFPHIFFVAVQNTEKPVYMVWDLWEALIGYGKHPRYLLALSCVSVYCD